MSVSIIINGLQLAENLGMIARVMYNFDIHSLKLINPNKGIFSQLAYNAAKGASHILDNAQIFKDEISALADNTIVFAFSARERNFNKQFCELNNIKQHINLQYDNVGLFFGSERNGLSNQSLQYANYLVRIPTITDFSSLNISHSIAIACYMYNQMLISNNEAPKAKYNRATAAELNYFFNLLESKLEENNFFSVKEKQAKMLLNIKEIFLRNNLTTQEVKTLLGVVNFLSKN